MSGARTQVLALYRRLLTCAKHWHAKVPEATAEERAYIREETRRLFRANARLTKKEDVAACLREGEARLEIAVHYQNPYPRPVYLPPLTLADQQHRRRGATDARSRDRARPLYVRSLDAHESSKGGGNG